MKVAFDFDDVILPVAEHILRYYKKTYRVCVAPENYYGAPEAWGVASLCDVTARVLGHLQDPNYANLRPTKEAIDAIYQISSKHALCIVTGRPSYADALTQKTLEEYFLGIFDAVYYTSYNDMSFSGTKEDVCIKNGIDYLVDDNAIHAGRVARAGVPVILFGDYPWNSSVNNLPLGVLRARTWSQVVSILG